MKTFSIGYESVHGRQIETGLPNDIIKLDLSRRMIESIDLTPLNQLEKLEIIDLSNNRLSNTNLTPLSTMQSLKSIRLNNNKLKHIDLWPLRNLMKLMEIDLSQNSIDTINLTPTIQRSCINLDGHTDVEIDYSLRYLLGGKESTRITLCNTAGEPIDRSPRLVWKKFDNLSRELGVRMLLDRIRFFLKHVDSRGWFRFQKGVLEGFGIDELAGYDGNPRNLFENLKFDEDIHSLTNAVYDRAIDCLEEQVRNGGSTLFLDVEKMSGTRSSKIVPLIIDVRESEMSEVRVEVGGNRVNLLPLWLTHYGLEILSVLKFGLTTDHQGLDLLSRNLEQVGHSLNTIQVDFNNIKTPKNISEGLVDYIYSIASMN